MSLDFRLMGRASIFEHNITHNLGKMADAAGVYMCLWRPEEVGIKTASQLITPLETAIAAMVADPKRFRKYDAPNGWGTYDHFLPWLEEVLAACRENPEAEVEASR